MEHPRSPDDIPRVTEAELRADLATFFDCVAYAEDELVVMRDGQPIAAVIPMKGWRALRAVAEEVVEQLGEERLSALGPEAGAISLIRSVKNAAEQALVSDSNQPLTQLSPGVREVFRRVPWPGEPA